MRRSLYDVLEVRPGVSTQAIAKAFRRLARQCHPDMTADPAATRRFYEIKAAYETLTDPSRRRAYDRSLIAAPFIATLPVRYTRRRRRTWWQKALRFVKRRRIAAAATALCVLCSGALLASGGYELTHPDADRDDAARAEELFMNAWTAETPWKPNEPLQHFGDRADTTLEGARNLPLHPPLPLGLHEPPLPAIAPDVSVEP